MKDAWNGIKDTTSGITTFASDTFDDISDIAGNLINIAGDAGEDIVITIKRLTENPNLANTLGSAGDFINNVWNTTSNFTESTFDTISTIDWNTVKGNVTSGVSSARSSIKGAVNSAWDWVSTTGAEFATDFFNDPSATLGKSINTLATLVGGEKTAIGQTIKTVGEIITSALVYEDGVTETRYGLAMEKSWSTGSNSFLSQLRNSMNGKVGQYTISFLQNTPLDPSTDNNSANLYGNLLLGGPPLFNHISDPNNRTTINTFVKDSVFLSLTPGLPKFNGGSFTQSLRTGTSNIYKNIKSSSTASDFNNQTISTSNYTNQTEGVEEVMSYLLKNGLDPDFAEKDKRYYTFQAKYNQYYSYLETMLNTM
jgi:hypothetical protein